ADLELDGETSFAAGAGERAGGVVDLRGGGHLDGVVGAGSRLEGLKPGSRARQLLHRSRRRPPLASLALGRAGLLLRLRHDARFGTAISRRLARTADRSEVVEVKIAPQGAVAERLLDPRASAE